MLFGRSWHRPSGNGSGPGQSNLPLLSVANALSQGSRPLPCDFDEAVIARDLVQYGQDSLRLRQHSLADVGVQLQERIVHPQAVVLHPPLQQFDQLLLSRQALANL